MSLKFKILFLFVVAVIVPLIIAGIFLFQKAKDVLVKETTDKLVAIADLQEKHVNEILDRDVDNFIAVTRDYAGLGLTGEVLIIKKNEVGDGIFLTSSRFDSSVALPRIIPKENTNDPATYSLSGKEELLIGGDIVDYRNKHVFAVTRFIDKLGWGMVIKIDREEALAPANALLNVFITIIILIVFIAVVLSYLFSKFITSPIIELTKDLRVAKAKDDAIFASISDGLAVADKSGKVVFFNKNASDILGTEDVNGLIGVDQEGCCIFNPVTLKSLSIDKQPLILAVEGQVMNNVQLFIKNVNMPNGKFISVTATPIFLNDESIGGVVVFRDMTKENEVDRAKTEFISLASHQLRTPLSSINWYTEMLLDGDAGNLTPEQNKYLEEVYNGSQRMVVLVNSLLNVSRLDLGTIIIDIEPVDVIKLVKDVINEQKPQINEKKIQLDQLFSDDIPIIKADSKLLRIVLQNLLLNAIRYTDDGGKIELSISLDSKKYLLIKVSDTGYGIPEDQQEKIFTKFFRADNARKKYTEGTGLGLYIVKSIIWHFGGKVWFESEEDNGSTFFVSIPLKGIKKKEGTKYLS